jgi:hypothetical protein
MKERSSPIQRGLYLFLHLAIQVENRLSAFDPILDAGQVDEQRPLRPRPVPGRVNDCVVVVWPKMLARRVLVHADI